MDVNAHTNNSLWGPQIGGVIEYGHQDVWLRVEGKAALCENDANRDLYANVSGTATTHPTVYHDGTAEVADVSATLLWHFASAATFRIGYQAMWVDQLALAARNFETGVASLTNATAPVPIDMGGHLVYHGPFVGYAGVLVKPLLPRQNGSALLPLPDLPSPVSLAGVRDGLGSILQIGRSFRPKLATSAGTSMKKVAFIAGTAIADRAS